MVVEEGEQGSRFEEVVEKTVRLASLFPKVARQSHLVLNGSPNEYVEVSTTFLDVGVEREQGGTVELS